MSDLTKEQSCPYCGDQVDDSQAEWDEGRNTVECDSCKKFYTVAPIYKFLGFEINKNCEGCGEIEEECYCDCEDIETTEPAQAV